MWLKKESGRCKKSLTGSSFFRNQNRIVTFHSEPKLIPRLTLLQLMNIEDLWRGILERQGPKTGAHPGLCRSLHSSAARSSLVTILLLQPVFCLRSWTTGKLFVIIVTHCFESKVKTTKTNVIENVDFEEEKMRYKRLMDGRDPYFVPLVFPSAAAISLTLITQSFACAIFKHF